MTVEVSILTRSSDRMQHQGALVSRQCQNDPDVFQSSPGRLTGCNLAVVSVSARWPGRFNPHPVV